VEHHESFQLNRVCEDPPNPSVCESTCESLEMIEGPAHVNETLISEAIKVFDSTMALAKQLGNQDLYDIAATSHTNVKNRSQLNVSGLRVYFQGVKDGSPNTPSTANSCISRRTEWDAGQTRFTQLTDPIGLSKCHLRTLGTPETA